MGWVGVEERLKGAAAAAPDPAAALATLPHCAPTCLPDACKAVAVVAAAAAVVAAAAAAAAAAAVVFACNAPPLEATRALPVFAAAQLLTWIPATAPKLTRADWASSALVLACWPRTTGGGPEWPVPTTTWTGAASAAEECRGGGRRRRRGQGGGGRRARKGLLLLGADR